MAQKITVWLLITLVLSLGFGQLLRFEYGSVAIYLHDILVILIILVNLPTLGKKELWRYPGINLVGLGFVISWIYTLSWIPLEVLTIPALYLGRLVSYLTLFLVVRYQKIRLRHDAFILSGLVTLIIGSLQYFLLPDMRLFQYLGWDDHLNRLTLPHFDPTYTGIMLTLFLFMLRSQQRITAGLTLMAILATYARSVWLALVITQLLVRRNIYLLILFLLFGLYMIYGKVPTFGEGTNLLRTYSIESRFNRDWEIAKGMKWDLIPGIGYNVFANQDVLQPNGVPNHAIGANSSYMVILSTSGIIGLWGWLVFLKYLYLTSRHKAAIVFVGLASLFNNVLLYPFVLLWLLLVQNSETKKK